MRTRNAWLALVMLFSLIFPSLPVSAVVPTTAKKACAMKCCRPAEPDAAMMPKCHRVAPEPVVSDSCKCSLGSDEPDQELDLTLIVRTASNDLSFLLAASVELPAPLEQAIERTESPLAKPCFALDQAGHAGCWLGRAPPVVLG